MSQHHPGRRQLTHQAAQTRPFCSLRGRSPLCPTAVCVHLSRPRPHPRAEDPARPFLLPSVEALPTYTSLGGFKRTSPLEVKQGGRNNLTCDRTSWRSCKGSEGGFLSLTGSPHCVATHTPLARLCAVSYMDTMTVIRIPVKASAGSRARLGRLGSILCRPVPPPCASSCRRHVDRRSGLS